MDSPTGAELHSAQGAVLRFLVVDDERTNRLILKGLIERLGHGVIEAGDGREAVELFRREQPDVVLMDVMMPGVDGYQAARGIKQFAGERFVPVIFLTALTDEPALARCVESGGDDFLTKPYSRVLLEAKIAALLRTRALYDALRTQKNQILDHHRRLQNEQRVAERLFTNIVGRGLLDAPGVRYLASPLALFNGDLLLAACRPSGGFLALVGDFTGHGLTAAVGVIPVSEAFYAMAAKGHGIAAIASEINRKLHATLPPELFLSACLIEVDAERRTLTVLNAGLPDALVYGPDGAVRARLRSDHLPLGITATDSFTRSLALLEIADGDRILLYSDGLIEARDDEGRMFGEQRLIECLASRTHGGFDAIREELARFRGAARQSDDLTLLEITCGPQLTASAPAARRPSPRVAMPWRLRLELGPEALRTVDPLPPLVHSVTEIQHLPEHRERLYLLLAELYSNALEHGLLQLDSRIKNSLDGFADYYRTREQRLAGLAQGRITLDLRHEPLTDGGRIVLRVADSGPGFDHGRVLSRLDDEAAHSGRGIALLRRLCERVEYLDCGNVVEAVYRWKQAVAAQ